MFTGTVAIATAISKHDDPHLLAKILKRAIAVTAIVEFTVNFQSFPLWVELICVPILAMVGGMIGWAEAQNREEDKAALNLLRWILILYGLAAIGWSVNHAWQNPQAFWQWKTLIEFGLPFILLLWSMPFLWFLATYVFFEELMITRRVKETPWLLRHYFLLRTLWVFGFNRKKLSAWRDYQRRFVLGSFSEVNKIFTAYRNKCLS